MGADAHSALLVCTRQVHKNYECALVSDQPRHSVQLCSHIMHLQLAFVSRGIKHKLQSI
jgi:hypothetical protein